MKDKSNSDGRHLTWGIATICSIVGILMLAMFNGPRRSAQSFEVLMLRKIKTIQEVEDISDVKLPQHSNLIDARSETGLSPYLLAEIRMPQSGAKQIMSQFPNETWNTNSSDLLTDPIVNSYSNWQLKNIHHYVALDRVRIPNDPRVDSVSILIDTDDAASPIMYIYWVG